MGKVSVSSHENVDRAASFDVVGELLEWHIFVRFVLSCEGRVLVMRELQVAKLGELSRELSSFLGKIGSCTYQTQTLETKVRRSGPGGSCT